MSDRTVHARCPSGGKIVRYDRAGKWYVEWERVCEPLTLREAVRLATLPGAKHYPGKPGGRTFDARVAQVKRAASTLGRTPRRNVMADDVSGTSPRPGPSNRVLAYIAKALESERYAYARIGGSRNFRHEDVQDKAKAWIDSLRTDEPA